MKKFILAAVFACLAATSAHAQSNANCVQAATSGSKSCIGAVDTTGAYQENLPTSAGTSGQIKKATGSNNTSWVSQSSLGWVYLVCTPTFSAVSSGTSETVLAQCEIPSGFMSANSAVVVSALATRSSSANSDVFKWKVGTTGTTSDTQCGTNATLSATTSLSVGGSLYFVNEASTSTNTCMNTQSLLGNSSTNFPALGLTTGSSNVFVSLTGTPGTTGDTLTGVWMVAQYLPAAGGQ